MPFEGKNIFGASSYPDQRQMLRGVAGDWLHEMGAAQAFAEEPSDEALAREVIREWELEGHMDAQDYTLADLTQAFADYRAEVLAPVED